MNTCLFIRYNGKRIVLSRCQTKHLEHESKRIKAMTGLPLINHEASVNKPTGIIASNMLLIKEKPPVYILMNNAQAEYLTPDFTLGELIKAHPRGISSNDLRRL